MAAVTRSFRPAPTRFVHLEHIEAKGGWIPSGNEHFSGSVWNKRISDQPDGVTLLAVQFAPEARTDWHSHPGGQLLYVVSGSGVVRTEGGETARVAPGDVVHAPPGERHWHGATPDAPMMHLSITSGGQTDWAESVDDEEYDAAQ
jgi:quercetin dioxygenase-like cupin family protein